MARIADRFRKQLDIETPFLGVFPDLASAREGLRQAIHFSNNGWVNLCSPAHDLFFMPPFRALAISRIDPDDVELYAITRDNDDGERDATKKYGLPKAWLDRLKQLRQIQIAETRRVDDGSIDAYWAYQCTVVSPDLQGGMVSITKSREMDLRDGAPDLLKAAGKHQKTGAVNAARQHGPQSCESKAQNRAVAEALGVPRGMTEAEFYRPWITVALVPHVQVALLSQDAIDQAGLAIIGGTSALFGARRSAPALPPAAPAASTSAPPPAAAPAPSSKPNNPPPAPEKAPPARQPAETAMATEDQVKVLTEHWKRLGGQEFSRRAAEALGGPMPAGKNMTATQAGILVDLFAKDAPTDNPFA